MSCPTADERQLSVVAQWNKILFAWDDIFDVPAEDDLMDDAKGAIEINDRIFSIFHHSEMSKTQEIPVVTAFSEYVNQPTHQIGSVTENFATECGLNFVPRRPRLCKSALKILSVNTPMLHRK